MLGEETSSGVSGVLIQMRIERELNFLNAVPTVAEQVNIYFVTLVLTLK